MARKAATTPVPAPRRNANPERAAREVRGMRDRSNGRKPAAPAYDFDIPTDSDDLFKALKSAKGVYWTMNHRGESDQAKLDRQFAKIGALQEAWNEVRPPRATGGARGPRKPYPASWVVTVNPQTGRTASKAGAGDEDVRDLLAAAKSKGLVAFAVAQQD